MANARQVCPAYTTSKETARPPSTRSPLPQSGKTGSLPKDGMTSPDSGVGTEPVVQLAHRMRDMQRGQRAKRFEPVSPIAHSNARAPRVERHLQVVGGVANHQGARGCDVKLTHEFVQHDRTGLACGFIGRARSVEQALQLHGSQGLVEPAPALSRGHCQPVVPALEFGQQRQHTFKKADVVLTRQVVVAVTLPKLRVFLARYIGRRMGQRLHEPHADDVAGGLITGHGSTDVAHSRLNAARDDGGGVKKGSIPVKGDEVELARAHGFRVNGGCLALSAPPPNSSGDNGTATRQRAPEGALGGDGCGSVRYESLRCSCPKPARRAPTRACAPGRRPTVRHWDRGTWPEHWTWTCQPSCHPWRRPGRPP